MQSQPLNGDEKARTHNHKFKLTCKEKDDHSPAAREHWKSEMATLMMSHVHEKMSWSFSNIYLKVLWKNQ